MKNTIKIILIVAVVIVAVILGAIFFSPRDEMGDFDRYEPATSMLGAPVGGSLTKRVASLEQTENYDLMEASGGSNAAVGKDKQDRMIVRSGSLSVVTKDVRKSVDEVAGFVNSINGFVVSSQITGTADRPSATLQVRVPVEKFQESLDRAKGAGVRVTSEYSSGQDVTEDFVDTEARIKNLQASEAQFVEIMKRAQKISDILEVQTQLERVRGEIEAAQGHAQYLQKSAQLSSITIYFAIDDSQLPVVDPVSVWQPWSVIKAAFRALIAIFQGIGTILIWLIVLIPLWVVVVLVAYVIKRIVRRKKINV